MRQILFILVASGLGLLKGVHSFSPMASSWHRRETTLNLMVPHRPLFIGSDTHTLAVTSRMSLSMSPDDDPPESQPTAGIDLNDNPALYRVRIPRATGIEWGTDLSFAFVYVRGVEPGGAADLTGQVKKGDQICELRPVGKDPESCQPINLIGASFDTGTCHQVNFLFFFYMAASLFSMDYSSLFISSLLPDLQK